MSQRPEVRLSLHQTDDLLVVELTEPGREPLRRAVRVPRELQELAIRYAQRRYLPHEIEPLVRGLGAVFEGRIHDRLRALLQPAGLVRLVLTLEGPAASYPWEIAYFDGVPLWRVDHLSVLRSAPFGQERTAELPHRDHLRLLYAPALSLPVDGRVIPSEERERARKVVTDLNTGWIRTETAEDPVTLDRLARRVADADIVQIIAHGSVDTGTLVLGSELETARSHELVTPGDLSQVFDDRGVRLALVIACCSARPMPEAEFQSLVESVTRAGVPVVIGMQAVMTIDSANRFIRAFYEELIRTDDLDKAVIAGRLDVGYSAAGVNEGAVPVVYTRLSGTSLLGLGVRARAEPETSPPPTSDRSVSTRSLRAFNVPFARSSLFQGRESELDLLMLQTERLGRPDVTYSVVTGMGGLGKSQLASEFAYRAAASDCTEVIWWLRADDLETLVDDLGQLGRHVGLADTDDRNGLAQSTRRWLEQLGEPWLLIVDNAHAPAVIERWMPKVGPGHVVVTSRPSLGWRRLGTVRSLKPFDDDSSVAFLLQRYSTGAPNEKEHARRLAETLGHLPIALAQAASTMEATGHSYERMNDRITKRAGRILDGRHGDTDSKSCWALFGEMFSHLSPRALAAVRIMAWLDGDSIPRQFFGARRLWDAIDCADEDDADDVLGELLRIGLIDVNVQDGLISVHRLIQQYARESDDAE